MSRNEKEPHALRYDQEGLDRIAAALLQALHDSPPPPHKVEVEVEKSEGGGIVSVTARIYPPVWDFSVSEVIRKLARPGERE